MAENVDLPPITFRYEGLFDFDGMYAALIDWATHNGYIWEELSYKHKVPSPNGAEKEFIWSIALKVESYVQYKVQFFVHCWDLKEVEIDMNGKKQPLTSARIEIIIKPSVIYDWQNRFEGKKMYKLMQKFQAKALQAELDDHLDTLMYRSYDIHALIKKFFDLKSQGYAYKGYLGEN